MSRPSDQTAKELLERAIAATTTADRQMRLETARAIRAVLAAAPHARGGPLDAAMRSRLAEVLVLLDPENSGKN